MSLRVDVAGQEERNKNYFPQGCEIKRIKPNLGNLGGSISSNPERNAPKIQGKSLVI